VVEPDTGIITDTTLTPAAGPQHSDATVGVELPSQGACRSCGRTTRTAAPSSATTAPIAARGSH